MPIDIVHFRGAEEKKAALESQKKRCETRTVNVDKILDPASTSTEELDLVSAASKLDAAVKSQRYALEQLRAKIGAAQKAVGEKAKKKEPFEEEKALIASLKADSEALTALVPTLEKELASIFGKIGNIVHESVPVDNTEDHNTVIRTHGTPTMAAANLNHHELLQMIDGAELSRAVALAGHRAYFLRGAMVFLNQALINHGLGFLHERNYTALQPPYFMKKEVMALTAQLEEFDETLYRLPGDADGAGAGDNFLIATSEQPISGLHRNEVFEDRADGSALPIKYAGISTCFRKEAGSHGRDAWGIFRVHQFEKVEQFVLCDPAKSWAMLDEMVATSEEFIRSLGIPYRVVSIVSGALNNAAAKKNDIEAWFPTLGVYRELVSCSNCTDYQARAMNTRFGQKKADEARQYVHMLNGTLCATERTLCCILENYQTDKGIVVPEVLRKYMPGGMAFIPFVHERPVVEAGMSMEERKAAKKAAAAKAAAAKPE